MGENILNGAKTIGTTAIVISPALMVGQRTALTIINTSTSGQNISISWGATAEALVGVTLYPGGSWSESRDSFFMPSNAQIWGISSGAGGTITHHERVAAGGV